MLVLLTAAMARGRQNAPPVACYQLMGLAQRTLATSASQPQPQPPHQQQQQQQKQQRLLSQLPDGVVLLPMPMLSHTMTSGRISKWLKAEGDECQVYDLLLELETDTLVEPAYKLDSFAGTVTMLIETQEEAFVAKLLVQEGQEVPVGTPIALLADDPDKLQLAAEQVAAVTNNITNVYDEEQQAPDGRLRTLVWQSYLKEAAKQSGSCMST